MFRPQDIQVFVFLTIKNDQILLHCHFNKIMKECGTSF